MSCVIRGAVLRADTLLELIALIRESCNAD